MVHVDPVFFFKKTFDLWMTTGWKKVGLSWRKDAKWESLSKKYGKNRDHIRKNGQGLLSYPENNNQQK